MNISKFTQKSVQAVQDLEKVAYEYGNQEVEQEHLLYALLTQEDSLILKLIEKMDINKEYFINVVKKALDAKVKVSGCVRRDRNRCSTETYSSPIAFASFSAFTRDLFRYCPNLRSPPDTFTLASKAFFPTI